MAGRLQSAGTAMVAAAALLLLSLPADAQLKKGSHAAPSTEEKPRVDEKAYDAALKRIPDAKKPYDPWGQVHDDAAAKSSGKPK